jgi:hypothetical protein
MPDDQFPVAWTGRRAVVAFPGHVDVSNVDQLRDRLLAVLARRGPRAGSKEAWPTARPQQGLLRPCSGG